ncbi:MAG: sugar ABC transporter permease [Defluviitaleaceae bacterium]|nr:sugar ABC transporter permease [Defluviitaleaceae bacterium]MCL2273761.1 sugar ABC transporter permease [Defluviitaleaceae bacterium]
MNAAPRKRRKGLTLRGREIASGYFFIFPWLVGITFFFLLNVGRAARFSVNRVHVIAGYGLTQDFIGLQNFYNIFRVHGTFMREMFTSVGEMLINVPLIIFFSLFMAIILNRQFMGRGLVRAIFFLPVIMASAAIANTIEMSMGMIMGGSSSIPPDMEGAGGGFNAAAIIMLLGSLGMPPQISGYITTAIANLHEVIRSSGVQILIFLAALQSIPSSMYEVAQIEGATSYETFWKITIPMVSPLIITNVVYTVIDTYANAAVVETAHLTYIREMNIGASAAMSISSALLVCLVLFSICWAISRFIFYRD